MKAYSVSVNLKLALVFAAMLIAVVSLVYTNRLAHRLREREHFLIKLWSQALEQVAGAQGNPYLADFAALRDRLSQLDAGAGGLTPAEREAFLRALTWAESMPPVGEVGLAGEIMLQGNFGIPAIVTDSSRQQVLIWRHLSVPDTLTGLSPADSLRMLARLVEHAREMDESYPPIPIVQDFGDRKLVQYVHYSESRLVRELRIFPYIQLLFVALFILSGYLGFSYVRRSEQRSLWVGMAKEAAHQLGTPISSLMGWLELLRMDDLPPEQNREALDEVEKDISRLRRVASRFSDIGSMPRLEPMPLAPVVHNTADYMRRRIPQQGRRVSLNVSVPPDIRVPLNPELFEWVIENLLKNALDAIETSEGRIDVVAERLNGKVYIDVKDTGKGIDRRQWKNVFRPGYSTKKRGWGLGLSLAKRIVEDYHGGTLVLAASRVGAGTTFRIGLPIVEG